MSAKPDSIKSILYALFANLAIAKGSAAITGNPAHDAMGTIAIGVILIVIAVLLAIEVKELLIGQGVEIHVNDSMRKYLSARP